MGPIRGTGARSLYRRHVWASMLPKKRLSTYTVHFKWHHRNISKNDHASLETKLNEWRHAFIINVKRKVTIPAYKGDTQMEHDHSVQLFLPGPWRFLVGPAPVGPTLVPGPLSGRVRQSVGSVFVCLCEQTITVERNNIWTKYLTKWFISPYLRQVRIW